MGGGRHRDAGDERQGEAHRHRREERGRRTRRGDRRHRVDQLDERRVATAERRREGGGERAGLDQRGDVGGGVRIVLASVGEGAGHLPHGVDHGAMMLTSAGQARRRDR